ncbi:MAG: glutathione transferase GstA [Betaproteobacteria bacterium]|nr:glutathione transferase GstA [Betaproteobacteria bacterium]
MKLYFSPGASSLPAHIALREAGLAFEAETVDLGSKKTASGADFFAINPKGYVPALLLDDGEVLTEGPAILQYLADRAPALDLAPAAGTRERYRLVEWLNFLATEVHKSYSPLFNAKASEDWKNFARAAIDRRLTLVAQTLERSPYLLGEQYSVADAYLFTILGWSKWVNVDLAKWPVLETYAARIAARPAVVTTLAAEKAAREQTKKG